MSHAAADERPIPTTEEAEAYVAMVCFKHGPPDRIGVELEWTVHHRDHADRPLDLSLLAGALRDHAPPTVAPGTPHVPLAHGSQVTVEPGGQVEISSPPRTSVGRLLADVESDITELDCLLETAGLRRGESGIDAHRRPSRLLEVPRYAAMQQFLDGRGPWGRAMMCSTASTQVCLDAGQLVDVPLRWSALHSIGPALVALFANSAVVEGRRTGWASNRLRATLGTCPPFTHPVPTGEDPVGPWVDRVLAAPVMCVRRTSSHWAPDRPMSFGAWVGGAGESPPTYDDLDYHLSTLFPPVRPRGYIEVRYLDAQPTESWHQPALLLAALLSSREVAERACELTEMCAARWLTAARRGLEDDTLRSAARRLVELAADHLDPTVPAAVAHECLEALHRRTTDVTARRQPA
jgi:glutamate--cysteine ligase